MKHEKELFQSKVIETKKQNRIKQDEGNRRQIYLEKLRRERLPVDNQGSEGEREGFNRLQEGSQIQISQ